MNDLKHGIRPIDANALLDAMPKSTVMLRHQVVDLICNSPSIDISTVITGETSDGYHTFNELYHHRAVLFSVIVKAFQEKAWKARLHHDGTMYDGMFIVGIDTPEGQASYHYDIDPYWDMFECRELERAPEWDGHTPAQAIERIGKLEPVQHGRKITLEKILNLCPDGQEVCLIADEGCITSTPEIMIDFLIKSVTESTVTSIEPENGVLKVWIS